jgi:hypothetical protein
MEAETSRGQVVSEWSQTVEDEDQVEISVGYFLRSDCLALWDNGVKHL